MEDLDADGWDKVFSVNLRAVFLLSRAVFADMRTQGGGSIINIGSAAGREGLANASVYCASKFGLAGLTQTLAAEGRPHRIRACLLYPGSMEARWGARATVPWKPLSKGSVSVEVLLPEHVAELIVWIAQSPPEVVLNEVTVTPFLEDG